jgi:hypothetical protein
VIASFCGLETLIELILGFTFVDIDEMDEQGRTALFGLLSEIIDLSNGFLLGKVSTRLLGAGNQKPTQSET